MSILMTISYRNKKGWTKRCVSPPATEGTHWGMGGVRRRDTAERFRPFLFLSLHIIFLSIHNGSGELVAALQIVLHQFKKCPA